MDTGKYYFLFDSPSLFHVPPAGNTFYPVFYFSYIFLTFWYFLSLSHIDSPHTSLDNSNISDPIHKQPGQQGYTWEDAKALRNSESHELLNDNTHAAIVKEMLIQEANANGPGHAGLATISELQTCTKVMFEAIIDATETTENLRLLAQ